MSELREKIRQAKFTCACCGECCSGKDNEVMVSPDEVSVLMDATALSFEEIAEPYPDWIEYPDGTRITFGWVLRRGEDGNCMFLQNGRCTVYQSRPHLCRTYPFMLVGDELIISECPAVGAGGDAGAANTEDTAAALLARRDAEDAEFTMTEQQYQKHSIVSGSTVVIDSWGVHSI